MEQPCIKKYRQIRVHPTPVWNIGWVICERLVRFMHIPPRCRIVSSAFRTSDFIVLTPIHSPSHTLFSHVYLQLICVYIRGWFGANVGHYIWRAECPAPIERKGLRTILHIYVFGRVSFGSGKHRSLVRPYNALTAIKEPLSRFHVITQICRCICLSSNYIFPFDMGGLLGCRARRWFGGGKEWEFDKLDAHFVNVN